jgi:hypothetical protein
MTTKTGSWLMAVGAFITFVGLCFLPAAFGPDSDRTLLGAGAVVIAMGLLFIAVGFYLKASALTAAAPPSSAASPKRSRSKSICDMCAENEPVIQCRVHQLHLCADCLNKHYDFRSCAYVPSTRRANPKSSLSAYSQASSG